MCRNITELRGLEPPATDDEVEAAARQFIRKVSGLQKPPAGAEDVFEQAVARVAGEVHALLDALPSRRQPPATVPPLRRPEVRARIEGKEAARPSGHRLTRRLHMSVPQVRLVPATVPLLNALDEDRTLFGELIGSPVPDGWPEFPEAIGHTLVHLQTAPGPDRAWSMQFFIDSATGRLLGSGGFAAPPVDRTVEIGYEVAPEFRGQGFGTAAARALVERAVASSEVDHVIAHTLPGPNASTGVLVSLSFEHVADQEDPEVGTVWEWRWTRPPAM